MKRSFQIYCDGACSGNPGPAGIGFVIKEGERNVKEVSRPIGKATNNIAEYTAMIQALEEAHALKADAVVVHTDSELMYHQLRGEYKVKNENIKPLHAKLIDLASKFKGIEMKKIPREQNCEADNLAKQSIKKEQTGTVASPFKNGGEESPSSKG